MKIYTKRGDQGQTDLLSKRVEKDDLHIDVNGTFDEAMGMVIMMKHYVSKKKHKHDLNQIHQYLFNICYEIALDDPNKKTITDQDVQWVEQEIDQMDQILPKLTQFIKLDQTKAASWANMIRVTVRRAERRLIELSRLVEINPATLKMANRLSDYFFTLGRFVS